MFRGIARHPVTALAVGGVLGGLLSMYAVLTVTGESVWDAVDWGSIETDDLAAMHRADLRESLLLAATVGGFAGAILGGALWLAFTRRPLPSMVVVLSWWLLGVIGGLILAGGVLALPSMSRHLSVGRDGSGGPGVGLLILLAGLAGVVTGSVAGVGIGVYRVRTRNRAATDARTSPS
jgi:hypothetical protein